MRIFDFFDKAVLFFFLFFRQKSPRNLVLQQTCVPISVMYLNDRSFFEDSPLEHMCNMLADGVVNEGEMKLPHERVVVSIHVCLICKIVCDFLLDLPKSAQGHGARGAVRISKGCKIQKNTGPNMQHVL